MARTSLMYVVNREEKYDYAQERTVNKVTGRSYCFSVSGSKTQEEHEETVNKFATFLAENNISSDMFGSGTWSEAVRLNDTKEFLWLSIPVEDTEDKELIKNIYEEWKALQKK